MGRRVEYRTDKEPSVPDSRLHGGDVAWRPAHNGPQHSARLTSREPEDAPQRPIGDASASRSPPGTAPRPAWARAGREAAAHRLDVRLGQHGAFVLLVPHLCPLRASRAPLAAASGALGGRVRGRRLRGGARTLAGALEQLLHLLAQQAAETEEIRRSTVRRPDASVYAVNVSVGTVVVRHAGAGEAVHRQAPQGDVGGVVQAHAAAGDPSGGVAVLPPQRQCRPAVERGGGAAQLEILDHPVVGAPQGEAV